MRISISSVMVQNQEHALNFYTEVLGFTKKSDVLMGEYRWLTVASPDGIEGVELVLEPIGFQPAQAYQQALYDAGIPLTAFITDDVYTDFNRLKKFGVKFEFRRVVQ